VVRKITYRKNIVEQAHRAVTQITKPMLGFKSYRAASNVLARIKLMHMNRKVQVIVTKEDAFPPRRSVLCTSGLIVPRTTARLINPPQILLSLGNATESLFLSIKRM
jgi:hypothetical protein